MTISNQQVVTGIVLNSMNYKENDALLHVFTLEYGKITIHARGIKKVTSKNMPACQTLTMSEFTIIVRKGICTLIKATPVEFYMNIKKDIIKEAYASFMLEYFYKSTHENEPNLKEYEVLKQGLTLLNSTDNNWLIYVLFLVEILKTNGTELTYQTCSSCKENLNIIGLSFKSGGFICLGCYTNYDKQFNKEILQAFRLINASGFLHFNKLEINNDFESDLVVIMEKFYDEFISINCKSIRFIQQFREYG